MKPRFYVATLTFGVAAPVNTQETNTFRLTDRPFEVRTVHVVTRVVSTGLMLTCDDVDGTPGDLGGNPDPSVLISILTANDNIANTNTLFDGSFYRNPRPLPIPWLWPFQTSVEVTGRILKQASAGLQFRTQVIFEGVEA